MSNPLPSLLFSFGHKKRGRENRQFSTEQPQKRIPSTPFTFPQNEWGGGRRRKKEWQWVGVRVIGEEGSVFQKWGNIKFICVKTDKYKMQYFAHFSGVLSYIFPYFACQKFPIFQTIFFRFFLWRVPQPIMLDYWVWVADEADGRVGRRRRRGKMRSPDEFSFPNEKGRNRKLPF